MTKLRPKTLEIISNKIRDLSNKKETSYVTTLACYIAIDTGVVSKDPSGSGTYATD